MILNMPGKEAASAYVVSEIIDNLKITNLQKASWFSPQLNPKYLNINTLASDPEGTNYANITCCISTLF